MWWQILAPILVDLIRKILERRLPVAAGAPAPSFGDDGEECDRFIAQLQHVQSQAAVGMRAGTVGSNNGILAHVTELITALQNRDWTAVLAVVKDLLGHL